jgi:uncharacterized protein YjbJ (UPF0337 family)
VLITSSLWSENYFTPKYNEMNTTEIKGNWNKQKGKLKQKFAILTDNDLFLVEGKNEELIGRLQAKLGKTKEEIHKIISEL